MSRSYNRNKKLKRAQYQEHLLANGSHTPDDFEYEKSIKGQIRSGKLPRRFFVKGNDDKLERDVRVTKKGRVKSKLTWATRSTLLELTKK